MKVHRIVTTIEVENDNSITSVELINLHPTNTDVPLAITNLTSNGSADDIEQVYDSVNKCRLGIAGKLKGIARIVNNSISDDKCKVITDYNFDDETTDDLLL